MSANADLQDAVQAVLGMAGRLRVAVPIVGRRDKDKSRQIQENAAKKEGLCLIVLPPVPTGAMQGNPDVFIEAARIRVRIFEQPARSETFGCDGYDLMDDVMQALHWQPHKALQAAVVARMEDASEDSETASAWVAAQPENAPLVALGRVLTAHPMYLRANPVEMAEDPVYRLIDVIFEAQYGLRPTDSDS